MDSIYRQARIRKFEDKTEKSFNNILAGFKSHQTFFDAMMQAQLPFYNCQPEVLGDTASELQFFPYFYDSAHMTFQALRLLTQTMAARSFDKKDFYPVTNQLFIQRQIKSWLRQHDHTPEFYKVQLIDLYQKLSDYVQPLSYQLLPDAAGNHHSAEEICRSHKLTSSEYQLRLLHELNHLTHLIKQHHIFNTLYIRMPLQSATEQTKHMMEAGLVIKQIAKSRGVKVHTIEDHIIEMIIKDYDVDVSPYIMEAEINEVRSLYQQHHFQRLKPYFEQSQIDSYFKVKLALCFIMKEVKG